MPDMDLSIQEDIPPRPKVNRPGGSGREPELWEQHLAPLKEEGKAGLSFRPWSYEKKSSAISRLSAVRERLRKAVPHENWMLVVRPVPGEVYPEGTMQTQVQKGVDNEGNTVMREVEVDVSGQPSLYGVYVMYDGTFTPEQITENARKHTQRSKTVSESRAAAKAAEAQAETPEVDGATSAEAPSAKERVASTHKAKAGAAAK